MGWLGCLECAPHFHSEADFSRLSGGQVREAWPQHQVRLETRLVKGVHLDMLLTERVTGHSTALELTYLTAFWQGEHGGETFDLLNPGAQDVVPRTASKT
jgi:hypothetical protein